MATLEYSNASHAWKTEDTAFPGIKVLRMDAPPVNALTREVMKDMITKVNVLKGDDDVKGVVLASARPNVFSAGLNIKEMEKPDPVKLREYLSLVQDLFLNLYAFPKPVVAAVAGAAPAGGCWLATLSDARVGLDSDKAVIGLNETQLGIIAPFYFAEPLSRLVGPRAAERMLQLGSLVTPRTALQLGIFDELHASKPEVETAAARIASQYVAVPAEARTLTKLGLRRPLVERLQRERAKELDSFTVMVTSPSVQREIGRYLASLSKK